jgi:hypothetical protein
VKVNVHLEKVLFSVQWKSKSFLRTGKIVFLKENQSKSCENNWNEQIELFFFFFFFLTKSESDNTRKRNVDNCVVVQEMNRIGQMCGFDTYFISYLIWCWCVPKTSQFHNNHIHYFSPGFDYYMVMLFMVYVIV